MESLGGSRGRNDGFGGAKNLGGGGGGGGVGGGFGRGPATPAAGGAGGGVSIMATAGKRPVTARSNFLGLGGTFNAGATPPPGGARGGGGEGGAARPSSAPHQRSGGAGGGGGGGDAMDVRARVEEKRLVKEAQHWGQTAAPKRDLPAFWSISTHGQPFNDERVAQGAGNFGNITGRADGKNKEPETCGPATSQLASMRKCLETGVRTFSFKDFKGPPDSKAPPRIEDFEREYLLSKMGHAQRIQGLRNCLDRDSKDPSFVPWTTVIDADLAPVKLWHTNRELAIRRALSKLEYMMQRHLQYLSEAAYRSARAPAAMPNDVLRRAFWKVDPHHTGSVSLQQFIQVWQNVLQLMEFTTVIEVDPHGKKAHVLTPKASITSGRDPRLPPEYHRRLIDRNMAAAIFVKFGFDKEGLLPYVIFIQALCATPARLLGHEVVLDQADLGKNGLFSESDISLCSQDAKLIVPKCKTCLMPPSGFDPLVARRSSMLPRAHMWLEHVYGYDGENCLSNNLFYTHNCTETITEIVFYSGCVGIVFNKDLFDRRLPCQRFFFGHDNDIQCLAIHPNRRWAASGQQLAVGSVPFACVWDVDSCELLQKLDHGHEYRGVIACGFSGNINAPTPKGLGGEVLVTVTSDDRHSVHIWRWMVNKGGAGGSPSKGATAKGGAKGANPNIQNNNNDDYDEARNQGDEEAMYQRCQYIPGWFSGPDKKLAGLKEHGLYYVDKSGGYEKSTYGEAQRVADGTLCPAVALIRDVRVKPDAAEGLYTHQTPDPKVAASTTAAGFGTSGNKQDSAMFLLDRHKADDTYELLGEPKAGYNGTPPTVYGVTWNPLRPSNGQRGSEFATYGVKHLKSWIMDDKGTWVDTCGAFGNTKVQNVLSAIFVPAMHAFAGPGDSCLLTGMANGQIGLWVPPYPTKAGSQYQLMKRMFEAHGPGKLIRLNDGTQIYGGVRVLRLRHDDVTVLSGGSDGVVFEWKLSPPADADTEGFPIKGVKLSTKPVSRYDLKGESTPQSNDAVRVVGLDCIRCKPVEFTAGTSGCDIWEVDKDPRILVEGHEDDVNLTATHPADPLFFVSVCESGMVRLWNTEIHDVICSAATGFGLSGVAYSEAPFPAGIVSGWNPEGGAGYHLAVAGLKGRISIRDAKTLQPLFEMNDAKDGINDMKYSPRGGPDLLACACKDLKIYIYRVKGGYQLIGRCIGHSNSVEHLDWSYPISTPIKMEGRFILQSTNNAGELLHWDALTCKKVSANQRDASWHTVTCQYGFPVMGIWADGGDASDINACCRTRRGAPSYTDPGRDVAEKSAGVSLALAEESSDGVSGAGFLATADDYSLIKLFNYPVVMDDAPYRAYRGHASHVMDVRFTCDDRYLVSVGGNDRGIYQWRTCGINQQDQQQDNIMLEAMAIAVQNKRDGRPTNIPKPGGDWGPLDATGRVQGPLGMSVAGGTRTSAQMGNNNFGQQSMGGTGRQQSMGGTYGQQSMGGTAGQQSSTGGTAGQRGGTPPSTAGFPGKAQPPVVVGGGGGPWGGANSRPVTPGDDGTAGGTAGGTWNGANSRPVSAAPGSRPVSASPETREQFHRAFTTPLSGGGTPNDSYAADEFEGTPRASGGGGGGGGGQATTPGPPRPGTATGGGGGAAAGTSRPATAEGGGGLGAAGGGNNRSRTASSGMSPSASFEEPKQRTGPGGGFGGDSRAASGRTTPVGGGGTARAGTPGSQAGGGKRSTGGGDVSEDFSVEHSNNEF